MAKSLISKTRDRLKGMTPREVASETLLRTRRQVSRAISRASDSPHATYISDEDLRRSLKDQPLTLVAERIRERRAPRLTAGLADIERTAETIKQFFPDSVEQTRGIADEILA